MLLDYRKISFANYPALSLVCRFDKLIKLLQLDKDKNALESNFSQKDISYSSLQIEELLHCLSQNCRDL